MSEFDWSEVYEAAERCRNKNEGEIPEDFVLFLPDDTSKVIVEMAEDLFDRDVFQSGVAAPSFGVPVPYKHPFARTPRTKAGRAMEDFLQSMMGGGVTAEDQERIERIARSGQAGLRFSVENERIEYHSLGSPYRQTVRGQSTYSITFDEMKHLNPDLYDAILAQPKGKQVKITDLGA